MNEQSPATTPVTPPAGGTVNGTSYLYMAAAFVIVVAGMKAAEAIINPLLLSVFLSIISAPAYFGLVRRGMSTWASLLIVIGVLSFVFLGVVVVVMDSIAGFTSRQALYADRITEETQKLQNQVEQMLPDWLTGAGDAPPSDGQTTPAKDSINATDADPVGTLDANDQSALGGAAEDRPGAEPEVDSEASRPVDEAAATDSSPVETPAAAIRSIDGANPSPVADADAAADSDRLTDSNRGPPLEEATDPDLTSSGGLLSSDDERANDAASLTNTSVIGTNASLIEARIAARDVADVAPTSEVEEPAAVPAAPIPFTGSTEPLPQSERSWQDYMMEQFKPRTIVTLAAGIVGGIGQLLSKAFLILLTVIFILLEAGTLDRKVKDAFAQQTPDAGPRAREIIDSIHRYIVIKSWVSLATGVLIAIWLKLLGIPYANLWGLLAFVFNFVPNVGSVIAAVPAVLIAWLDLSVWPAISCAMGFLVVNLVIGNFVEPRVMGRGLGLSPLVVFCSMVFWGWVLGPVGMLLSVPLTMTARIALDGFEDTKWVATLMGNVS